MAHGKPVSTPPRTKAPRYPYVHVVTFDYDETGHGLTPPRPRMFCSPSAARRYLEAEGFTVPNCGRGSCRARVEMVNGWEAFLFATIHRETVYDA